MWMRIFGVLYVNMLTPIALHETIEYESLLHVDVFVSIGVESPLPTS